mmetsp:Transcript_92757/g.300084  ORF Transcript_92757/g.300084 Transcript_92757/m.300084 type:complete len:240 (-) Transcript_92757:9-728(-)
MRPDQGFGTCNRHCRIGCAMLGGAAAGSERARRRDRGRAGQQHGPPRLRLRRGLPDEAGPLREPAHGRGPRGLGRRVGPARLPAELGRGRQREDRRRLGHRVRGHAPGHGGPEFSVRLAGPASLALRSLRRVCEPPRGLVASAPAAFEHRRQPVHPRAPPEVGSTARLRRRHRFHPRLSLPRRTQFAFPRARQLRVWRARSRVARMGEAPTSGCPRSPSPNRGCPSTNPDVFRTLSHWE